MDRCQSAIAREGASCRSAVESALSLKRVAIKRVRRAAGAAEALRRARAALAGPTDDVDACIAAYRGALVDLVGCVERIVQSCDARSKTAEALVRKYEALASEVETMRRAAAEERARAAGARERRVGTLVTNPFAAAARTAK